MVAEPAGRPTPLSPHAAARQHTAAAAAAASATAAPGSDERQAVVLRVEVATKGQARLLTWSVWGLLVGIIVAAAVLSATQNSYDTLGKLRGYYIGQLAVASLCLALLLCLGPWLALSVQRSRRERRVWSKRQRLFTIHAAGILSLHTTYSCCYVAALALQVGQPSCTYAWVALSALEFVRKILFCCMLLFVLASQMGMCLWRGKGALDMHPDYRLVVDRPLADRARYMLPLFFLWVLLVASVGVSLASRLRRVHEDVFASIEGCGTEVVELQCQVPSTQVAGASLGVALLFVFAAGTIWLSRKATRDHRELPFVRYRDTHIFIRIQARVVAPVIVSVVLSSLLLELIPTLKGTCLGLLFSVTGNLPIELSLTVAVAAMVLLYMPRSEEVDSPLLQAFLQEFSWTAAAVPADLARRNALLEANIAAERRGARQSLGMRAVDFFPSYMRRMLGWLAGSEDAAEAVERLEHEPIFCVETAIRLLYWSRLAYQEEDELDNEYVSVKSALALFGLQEWEEIWDPASDTHAVLGWSAAQRTAVLAFRGTASLQNVLTDAKAWKVQHQAPWRPRGRTIMVHAGHSLGGALAVLAALELRKQHPATRLTVCTFGCPRVFDMAGAREFNAAVPDCWTAINAMDPVPWVPKWGFKRVGKRVTIDAAGNLVLRPSYFDLSVYHHGADILDHLAGSYALSLACFLKAQFSPSRAIRGGAAGVEALACAMDLTHCLCMQHADLASLRDPKQLPAPTVLEIY
ncbi:alpha beta-hydrolase isoform B [Chlorella sorokiniana]|uniref:Alpha beta-hydrolase isoform B n=1 Tax=Chlorella sorokiniana TaxID=3076 RepID=A0A2P6TJQ3_CHLSO|nr:alpha beta-hydrolase isoform B [Chlorella sorokiniana]|eukprot:PRW44314.1 alpha beta-hydrolase isoform B [Chlorella sorokiniana]